MVWGAIKNAIGLGSSDSDKDDGRPTRLPPYFPVEPKGCEKHSQKLFHCLSNDATNKIRDMERVGLHRPYFNDIDAQPTDPKAAEMVAKDPTNPEYPKARDNPLDECKTFIYNYKKCCDRNLRQKRNAILAETVRVQDEYRYQGPTGATTSSEE